MGVIITRKTNNFSIVSKDILWDKRLSTKARFLLIFCLSLAENWEFSVKGLAYATGAGLTTIRTSIMELEKIGYLRREQAKHSNGRFGTTNYVFYETPVLPDDGQETIYPAEEEANVEGSADVLKNGEACENQTHVNENLMTQEPISGKLMSENPTQYNTNKYNNNIIEYQRNNIYTAEPPTVGKTLEKPRKYAENVSMYEQEYQRLIDKLGDEDAVIKCIEILDNYKGAHGVKYKSDYRAILSWVINSYNEQQKKRSEQKNSKNDVRRAAASVTDMLDGGGTIGFF